MHGINLHTEHEIDLFLKKYIKSIPGIKLNFEIRLAESIKKSIIEMELPRLDKGMIGLMIPKYKYVIKNEDLPIFESLFDGLKTAAGANFFLTEAAHDVNKTWAAAIGVFSTFYKLCKNIRNKGKILPSLEFQALLCLKNYPEGIEPGYLLFLLRENYTTLNEDQLKQVLEDLGKVYMNDGTKKELVIFEDGLYKAKGI